MLSDDRLLAFMKALSARSNDAPRPRGEAPADLPADVRSLLGALAGRAFGDVGFATFTELAEAIASPPATPLWNAAWMLVASTETDLYAYDPLGCFRGRKGQVICLARADATECNVYPSLDFWLGALEHGAAEHPEAYPSNGARYWAEARGRLECVALPGGAEPGSGAQLFDHPLSSVNYVGASRNELRFDLFVAYALSRGRDVEPVLGEIARRCDEAVPYCQLGRLEEVGPEDASRYVSWFDGLVAKHAKKKGVTRLLFAQDSVAGGRGFYMWPAATTEEPGFVQRAASFTRAFERFAQVADEIELRFSSERFRFGAALLTFVVRDLLEASAARLPFEGELDVLVDGRLVGRVDTDGFVPAPLSLVELQDAANRDSATRGMRAMGFPGTPSTHVEHPIPRDATLPTRTLRHPDGRSVDVTTEASKWTCTMVEADGERDTFSRPVKTGWEAETFVAAQRRQGFVEG